MSIKLTEKILSSGIGKRKTSIAKIFFYVGSGIITINKKNYNDFFLAVKEEQEVIKKPLIVINLLNSLDVEIIVKGGGIFSQIEAIKLAICNAIVALNKRHKAKLKQELLLKNDTRIKERRKYGLKKARKAPQYSKR